MKRSRFFILQPVLGWLNRSEIRDGGEVQRKSGSINQINAMVACIAIGVSTPGLPVHALPLSSGCDDFNQTDASFVSPSGGEQGTGGDNFQTGNVIAVTYTLGTATHAQVSLSMETGKETSFHTIAGPT